MRLLRFLAPAAALASLIVLTASDAPAGCTTGGLWAAPAPGGALVANGRIVLEGSGNMADSVAALDSDGLVLASDTEEIPLRVESVNVGHWNVAQAILVPIREPAPGTRVALRASAKTHGSTIDATLQRDARLFWTTAASAPGGELHWTGKPKRGETKVTFGCPPIAGVSVRIPVDHAAQLLGILAEVRPLMRGAKVERYLLHVYDGEVFLGHQGCDSAIGLFAGMAHLVKLTAVDLAGREIPAPGFALSIASPVPRR